MHTVLHPSFYDAALLPVLVSAQHANVGWVSELPCSGHELVLVDAFSSGGHVAQRYAGREYDADVSDEGVKQSVANAMRKEWPRAGILFEERA